MRGVGFLLGWGQGGVGYVMDGVLDGMGHFEEM